MTHGIHRMSMSELDEALEIARLVGAYAMAERLAAEINEPRQPYVYPVRGEGIYGYHANDIGVCCNCGCLEASAKHRRKCEGKNFKLSQPASGFPFEEVMEHLSTGSGSAWIAPSVRRMEVGSAQPMDFTPENEG